MTDTNQRKTVRYVYRFEFDNGLVKEFEVVLDAETLGFLSNKETPKPEWTKLKYSPCEHCPLAEGTEYCPVAVNLANLVETFKDFTSIENAIVTVQSAERNYSKRAALQKGLSSLIGIIMVTSGCPIMDKLRPMARFHLPFATAVETFYRSLSMYLTAQMFLMRTGKTPDWELKEFVKLYETISKVNQGMARRLSSASEKDANVNALVILHAFGEAIPYFVENGLADIGNLFSIYTEEPKNE